MMGIEFRTLLSHMPLCRKVDLRIKYILTHNITARNTLPDDWEGVSESINTYYLNVLERILLRVHVSDISRIIRISRII